MLNKEQGVVVDPQALRKRFWRAAGARPQPTAAPPLPGALR